MDSVMNYIKPELLVVAIVLYFVGIGLKTAQTFKDKYIPLLLGIIGIVICAVYTFATSEFSEWKDVAMVIFTSVTQGILVAGLSTYVNQIVKQSSKTE